MPKILYNPLKISLLLGLFVFIALSFFTFCCFILCFVLCNNQVRWWYSESITHFFQKKSIFSSKYSKSAIKVTHTSVSWLQLFTSLTNHLKSPLHFHQHSKKHFKVLKSSLYKLKSVQKPSNAVEIYSTSILFSILKLRYCSFFNSNPIL